MADNENPYEGDDEGMGEMPEPGVTTLGQEDSIQGSEMVSVEAAPKDDPEDDEPPTRREKKRDRWKEHQRRTDAAEAKSDALQARVDALQSQFTQRNQQDQARDQRDPLADRLAENEARTETVAELYNAKAAAGAVTREDSKEYTTAAKKLEEERWGIRYEMKKREEPAPQAMDPARLARQARYPDIYKDPQALAMAQSKVAAWMRQNNDAEPSEDLIDEIAEETRKEFGMSSRGRGLAPTPEQRRNHGGVPRGRDVSRRKAPAKRIEMTRERKMMAEAEYDEMVPEDAHKAWAEKTGKRILQKEYEAGR